MAGNGPEQLRLIAARCKALGDRGVLNRARAEIRGFGKPVIAAAQANARARVGGRSGGLNEWEAAQPWRVSALTGARIAGIRLTTRAPGTAQTNAGYVRHPVFGRWAPNTQNQPVSGAGWADDALAAYGPVAAAAMLKVLDAAAIEIAGD